VRELSTTRKAETHSLLALAFAAVQYNLQCPIMTEEPILQVQNGRHFLHELTVPQYISNDTIMHGGQDGEYCSMVSLHMQRSMRKHFGQADM
jgi:DNA mismatch repair ATPase MutS